MKARLVKNVDTGSVLAVSANHKKVQEYLSDKISLAAINGPQRMVLAGKDKDIEIISKRLTQDSIQNKKLHTSHAFHSYMMDSMTEEFHEYVSTLEIIPPKIDIYSTVTSELMGKDICSARYWSDHVRSCVVFYPALEN